MKKANKLQNLLVCAAVGVTIGSLGTYLNLANLIIFAIGLGALVGLILARIRKLEEKIRDE